MVFTKVLANGLTVLVEPVSSIATTACVLMFRAGNVTEGDLAGGAHFLEHMLFAGSKDFPGRRDLSLLADNEGIQHNGSTGNNASSYYAEGMPDSLETMLKYLSQVTLHPLIREDDVDHERRVITKEIKQAADNSWNRVGRSARQLLYPDQNLGRSVLGSEEDIARVDSQKLRQLWQRTHVGNNAVLVIRGAVDNTDAQELVERYFDMMPAGQPTAYPLGVPAASSQVVVEKRESLKQALFELTYPGFLTGDRFTLAAPQLARALGGGITSRLYERLRHKEGLVYSVDGVVVRTVNYGVVSISAAADPASLERVLSIIREELERVADEGITISEWEQTHKRFLVSLGVGTQDNMRMARFACEDMLSEARITSVEKRMREIKSVTPEDIQEAARILCARPAQLFVLSPTGEELTI